MKKQTYIHIQEPCHENWSNMTSEEQGRFCHSCAKTVTDFSAMTDTEILKYLSAAQGNTCGRFATDQLNRQIHLPATQAKKTFWAYMLSMFLPVMIANRLSAQKISAKATTEQNIMGSKSVNSSNPDTTKPATPVVKGESIEEGLGDQKYITMGLVMPYEKVKATDTLATFVKKAIKNELFKIYPNPAVKGKKISIQVMKTGTYTLQLMDIDSKMIVLKSVTVSSKGQMVFLDIPSGIASGSYYLRLVQAGSDTQFVDKLVVK